MQMPVSPMCQRIADEEQTKQSIAAVQVNNRHIQIGVLSLAAVSLCTFRLCLRYFRGLTVALA